MTEKNGIRIDVLALGEAENQDITLLVRANGCSATFTLLEVVEGQLSISKDYSEDLMDYIRCLINTGHHLHEKK